ncbi:hypothetical protein [Pontibacter cellulosilyticus]|uniref:Uncharacterized protein n=1 Tax=Pontibacter cellulosilyticus TaxID=1720253 RepID=A0A923N7B3_9BACT|nr:hypothetical protein [Pontibacter cellulosilyticus]MBC5993087.1 hypothetical protein [Pontibacter cellulosilyticus]
MKNSYLNRLSQSLPFAAILLIAVICSSYIQKQQDKNSYTGKEFKSLRWLEGTWKGTADGEAPFFEKYEFVNDTLMQITYYSDSSLKKGSTDGGVYFSGGKIYHNYKSALWELKQLDGKSAAFVPLRRASNSFTWKYTSPNEWTATLFAANDSKGKTYRLQRIKK